MVSPQTNLGVSRSLPAEGDLESILSAWHTATVRLQQTHEVLRGEVKRLTDELEIKNRELARKNRLADLGQMASHVAHEVRNSLMPMTLYLSLLRRGLPDDAGLFRTMDKIESGFTALEAIVNDLLHFTTHRAPHWQPVSLRQIACGVCEALETQLSAQEIFVEIDIDENMAVQADPDMLRRCLLNLVLNAIDVMPAGGELSFTAIDDGSALEIEIADSGPGIDSHAKTQLFEPFFTTKHHGTGLGLAIVQRIAEAHGGNVIVANCPQGGAAFTLRIPHRKALRAAA